jgi:hypothetical protein
MTYRPPPHPSQAAIARAADLLRPEPQRPRMTLITWKPVARGALLGFATIELPIGLQIADCGVFCGDNGRFWASLPARPQLEDGRHRRDAAGKALYVAVLEWRSKELRNAWSDAVIDLVRATHPEAFSDGASR